MHTLDVLCTHCISWIFHVHTAYNRCFLYKLHTLDVSWTHSIHGMFMYTAYIRCLLYILHTLDVSCTQCIHRMFYVHTTYFRFSMHLVYIFIFLLHLSCLLCPVKICFRCNLKKLLPLVIR